MKSDKPNQLLVTLLSFGAILSNNVGKVFGIDCIDSPLELMHPGGDGTPFTCTSAYDTYGCTTHVASHCPLTCNSCDTLKCSDSTAGISSRNTKYACAMIEDLLPEEKRKLCKEDGPQQTCRSSCGFCKIGMDFDDQTFDLNAADEADYYYASYNHYDYFNDELLMENVGFYKADASPGTGFFNGLVNGENVAFNEYGDPARLMCPGGSFTVKSMWATSAWLPQAPVMFHGVKTDGTSVSFTMTLPNTTTPKFLRAQFSDFNDLIELTIDTPRDGDIVVLDDMRIVVSQQCVMPISDKGRSLNAPSRPDFSPIYPRH